MYVPNNDRQQNYISAFLFPYIVLYATGNHVIKLGYATQWISRTIIMRPWILDFNFKMTIPTAVAELIAICIRHTYVYKFLYHSTQRRKLGNPRRILGRLSFFVITFDHFQMDDVYAYMHVINFFLVIYSISRERMVGFWCTRPQSTRPFQT